MTKLYVCYWHLADMLDSADIMSASGGKADVDQPLLTKLDHAPSDCLPISFHPDDGRVCPHSPGLHSMALQGIGSPTS